MREEREERGVPETLDLMSLLSSDCGIIELDITSELYSIERFGHVCTVLNNNIRSNEPL